MENIEFSGVLYALSGACFTEMEAYGNASEVGCYYTPPHIKTNKFNLRKPKHLTHIGTINVIHSFQETINSSTHKFQ